MSSLIIENSKYIILILFLGYMLGCVFQNRIMDIAQKMQIIGFVVHVSKISKLCLNGNCHECVRFLIKGEPQRLKTE